MVDNVSFKEDIYAIGLQKQNAVIMFDNWTDTGARTNFIAIHYNNGITSYNETYEENY